MFFLTTVFFVLGTSVGSFLNVVIDRTSRGESILGRSYCDWCRAKLTTVDLIPIISFFLLSRKCRHCKKALSWQYPLVESLCGVLFALTFWQLSQSGQLALTTIFYTLFLVSVMIVVAVVDMKFSLIPTSYVYAASLIALFYNFFLFDTAIFIDRVIAAFGAALFFLAIVLITRGRGMGEGDIVLGFLMGMVLGKEAGVLSIFLAFVLGAVVSLFLIILGKKKFGQTIPFAPFLVLGFILSLFWASPIIDWYLGNVLVVR